MRTNTMNPGMISSWFFEIGLGVKLNKITLEEITKYLSLENVKSLAEKVDQTADDCNWDDSHIKPGQRLRAALEIHEVSQAELAKKLKVSRQKVNDLISGRLTITIDWAKRIGDVLGVSYKNFL